MPTYKIEKNETEKYVLNNIKKWNFKDILIEEPPNPNAVFYIVYNKIVGTFNGEDL